MAERSPNAKAEAPAKVSMPRSAMTPLPPVMPFDWACAYGEDEFGLWQAFEVGGVRQALRWIPRGEFWMGSTDVERQRMAVGDKQILELLADESPRHRVVLSQGFWLADSACTQALWQVVVGENPSRFTGDLESPVEQVSWNDITQIFLTRLNALVPSLDATLPTEAQWECACRAGTETAYAFGDVVTPEQVNFDGNYPPPGVRKGEYRGKTVQVKTLPANAWGLHEMHGNLFEWCLDGQRSYEAGTAVDPVGPQDLKAGERVLRGGNWGNHGGGCRSAGRNAGAPDGRYGGLGFRLARGAS